MSSRPVRIFKFGGASVKDADAVRNVASILRRFNGEKLVVVISAMGKTTNALEAVHDARYRAQSVEAGLGVVEDFHRRVATGLFGESDIAQAVVDELMAELHHVVNSSCDGTYDREYDRVVSLGEWFSTRLVFEFLQRENFSVALGDARRLIVTDDRHRDARVNWDESAMHIERASNAIAQHDVYLVQGFIAATSDGITTTLGREGSDFTASIFAYLLNAADVTIWKDVPGMLNADPRRFDHAVKLERISYHEAIELAYFGASVIHPKTIKPLQNKHIPLYIKSFLEPDTSGTEIQDKVEFDKLVPSFIVKDNQVLISLSTRDFSFVVEDNLRDIFDVLVRHGIRIHIMENSAISFSMCMDAEPLKLERLFAELSGRYSIRYNEGLSLVTIRHYDEQTVAQLTSGREILLEQRSRETIRLVLR